MDRFARADHHGSNGLIETSRVGRTEAGNLPMSTHMKTMLAFALAVLAAGSGEAKAADDQTPGARAAGGLRPATIRPDTDENLQWAASVVQLDALRPEGGQTVKLFGTAGGDPAMNGLYTYLAFFESPGDGWRVFRLGDFLTYRIISQAPGRLALDVRESVMNVRTGDIGTRVRRLAVNWTPGAGGAPPASVRVTSAR